jgi:hypothetical protein
MRVFEPIILEMNNLGLNFTQPQSYLKYKKNNHITNSSITASVISVDFLDRLDPELKRNGIMIFRLGSPNGSRGTSFALSRTINGFNDYFLDETQLLDSSDSEHIVLDQSKDLNAFKLLPRLTETSLVNLAFASGILSRALELDDLTNQIIPATCQSTFSFKVKPHENFDVEWEHQNGQVEIDALFYGKRKGKNELYLIESKFGSRHSTLAKHKLVYPYLAIKEYLKEEINIVPIYLKTSIMQNSIQILFTECTFVNESYAISSLKPLISKRFLLKDFLCYP